MIASRFLGAILLPAMVLGHSWLACSDYAGVGTSNWNSNLKTYTKAQCQGFPRDFTTFNGGPFGADRGFNFQARGGAKACITDLSGNSYNAEWPKATYTGGERIRALWPAKNHDAGSRCTNPFIPDTEMKLFRICGANRAALGAAANPTVDQVLRSELVVDWKLATTPAYAANGKGALDENWGTGFQNCPFFCDDTDKAVCFQEFDVPNVAAATECTYIWYWVFNRGDAPYLTCFDATILPGSGSTSSTGAPATTAAPATTGAPGRAPAAPATTAAPSGSCGKRHDQCGGENFRGPTCCQSGDECVRFHQWFSQCLQPGTGPRSVSESDSSLSTGIAGVAGFFVGGVLAVVAVALIAVVAIRKHRATKSALETELIVRS